MKYVVLSTFSRALNLNQLCFGEIKKPLGRAGKHGGTPDCGEICVELESSYLTVSPDLQERLGEVKGKGGKKKYLTAHCIYGREYLIPGYPRYQISSSDGCARLGLTLHQAVSSCSYSTGGGSWLSVCQPHCNFAAQRGPWQTGCFTSVQAINRPRTRPYHNKEALGQ